MWVDFLSANAAAHPDREALLLCESGRRLSYADLDREASSWAEALHHRGVHKGDRVAFLATNRLEHLTLFFACARLGAIFAPLNFRLAPAEIAGQLAQIEAAVFLTAGETPDIAGHPARNIADVKRDGLPPAPRARVAMDDVLLMLFTSGSTGRPKGVMLHAGMLLWNIFNTALGWGLRRDDVSVIHTPFFHTGGFNVTCLPLLHLGGRLILTPRFDPGEMLGLIEIERVSVFFAVPSMFAMKRDDPDFARADLSSIRFCISGGAPCPRALIEAYRERGLVLRQGFGLTEVGPNCFRITEEEAAAHPDSVGRPMMHSRVKLIDEAGETVPPGQAGELCIRGPHVCAGYWRAPEIFAKVYRDGWFHTGDLMRRDEAGRYRVIGRKKEMYISGGENVYPGEVVRALLEHPDIADAMVVAVPHPKWGEVGYAYLKTRAAIAKDDLRAFLDPRLSRYKHPFHLCCLEDFPLLPNNKVDRRGLWDAAVAEVTAHG